MGSNLRKFVADGTCEDIVERYASLPEIARISKFGALDADVVVVDTETTGFSFNHDELTQIAAARMVNGEIIDWFITFVNPGKPIPEDVAHLTNIHDEDVASAPNPSEALAQLVDFVGSSYIVAHNVEFDKTFTTRHASGYSLLEKNWIDSLDLARICLPRMKSHRLLDLVKAFDAPLSTHRADADVEATCVIYRILLAGVKAMPYELVCEIASLADQQEWSTQAVFEYFACQGTDVSLYEGQRNQVFSESVSRETLGGSSVDSNNRTNSCTVNNADENGLTGFGKQIATQASAGSGEQSNSQPAVQFGAQSCAQFDARSCSQVNTPAFLQPDEQSRSRSSEKFGIQKDVQLSFDADGRTSVSRETSRNRFSLRSLRRDRVSRKEYRAKIYADELAADPNKGLKFPTQEEIDEAFSPHGLVGKLYESFEPRNEQVQMSKEVLDAFSHYENLVVEAGTGVGKSMAYLVPAALTAKANGIAVGVATKTNALLDQLVYHELPALASALSAANEESTKSAHGSKVESVTFNVSSAIGCSANSDLGNSELSLENSQLASDKPSLPSGESELTFAALKGFSHYPCLKKIDRIVADGAQLRMVGGKEQTQAPALAALLSFVEQTEYDDMDGLKIDYRLLPRRAISTTSHDCLRRKCPYFGTSCFVHGSRRRAEAADIVVTNHSLLFCDLVADGGLLPPIRYWIIDEAHSAESEARRAFSVALAAEDIMRLVSRVSSDEASRNVFVRAERRITIPSYLPKDATGSSVGGMGLAEEIIGGAGEEGSTLFYALLAKARSLGKAYGDAAGEFCTHMKDLLYFDGNKRGRSYETVELWINDDIRASETFGGVRGFGKTLVEKAEKLVTACQELVGYLEDFDGAAEIQREIASIAMELKDQLRAAEIILEKAPEAYAYSATLCRKNDRMVEKLEALLVNVGDMMNETLYARTHSTVFASATLAVNGKFKSFEDAMGLNASEFSVARSRQLDSSYDFDGHMTIYVVEDMPEPNEVSYLKVLQELLVATHIAQEGSMLTLFTNRREMEKCFEGVQPLLKEKDLRLVCQKWGVSVKGLRDDFLADEHLSLFALKSFWEGFDAPGATLKGVIIPKLPFAKPTDPLSCERAARDDQAWRRYVLPQAILETKQAAGRLIRKADDEGVLILADRRLLSKSYGKAFLNSMPSKTIKVMKAAEIVQELQTPDARAEAVAQRIMANTTPDTEIARKLRRAEMEVASTVADKEALSTSPKRNVAGDERMTSDVVGEDKVSKVAEQPMFHVKHPAGTDVSRETSVRETPCDSRKS